MNRKARARQFHNEIKSIKTATQITVRDDELTPEELNEVIDIYPAYEVGTAYKADDVIKHNGKLYKVVQAHTSQTDWAPQDTPALYNDIMPDNVIGEWKQPAGAHDSYAKGAQVIYDGKVYASEIDGNVWKPGEYGWELNV